MIEDYLSQKKGLDLMYRAALDTQVLRKKPKLDRHPLRSFPRRVFELFSSFPVAPSRIIFFIEYHSPAVYEVTLKLSLLHVELLVSEDLFKKRQRDYSSCIL